MLAMLMNLGFAGGGTVVVAGKRAPVLFMENISTFMNR